MRESTLKIVYDDQEVVLTGQVARKPSKVDKSKRRQISQPDAVLVEISSMGLAPWTKWVKREELFVIQSNETITAEDLLDLQ